MNTYPIGTQVSLESSYRYSSLFIFWLGEGWGSEWNYWTDTWNTKGWSDTIKYSLVMGTRVAICRFCNFVVYLWRLRVWCLRPLPVLFACSVAVLVEAHSDYFTIRQAQRLPSMLCSCESVLAVVQSKPYSAVYIVMKQVYIIMHCMTYFCHFRDHTYRHLELGLLGLLPQSNTAAKTWVCCVKMRSPLHWFTTAPSL